MSAKSVATFTVRCEEAGFSRSMEIPITSSGYVRALVEDMERALELYQLRAENRRLRDAAQEAKELLTEDSFEHADAAVEALERGLR